MTPDQFIAKMSLHFRLQMEDQDEQNEWLKDAAEALQGTAPNVLAAAAKAIIRDRESPWFPTIGECVQACRLAAAKIHPVVNAPFHAETWPEPTPEQKAAVNAMVEAFKQSMKEKTKPDVYVPVAGLTEEQFNAKMATVPDRKLTERSRRMMGDEA